MAPGAGGGSGASEPARCSEERRREEEAASAAAAAAADAAVAAQDEDADAPAAPAAATAVDGASDYAAPEVEGTSEPALEQALADLVRRIELGEVDERTLQALEEMGVIRIRRRRPSGGAGAGKPPVLAPCSLEGVAEYIKSGRAKKIIMMCGAGVSVSAGIPDFRTPGTGLYSQLARLDLPTPEAVFELGYFRRNPRPFHLLAKELFPGNFAPSPAHVFMKLLADKGLLLRVYTQNIDSLEHEAGLGRDKVVAAHGNFDSAHCIRCDREHSLEHVKEAVFAGEICYCKSCGGLVKPDIVFFGENLPDRFYDMAQVDFPRADLLIVMGTSLVVNPFASLIDGVRDDVPRLLINRERVGEQPSYRIAPGIGGGDGFDFDSGYRDALFLGDCDDGAARLAGLLGWGPEFERMVEAAGCRRAGEDAGKAAESIADGMLAASAGSGSAAASASASASALAAATDEDEGVARL